MGNKWIFPVTEFNKPIALPIMAKSLYIDNLWPTSEGICYWLRTIIIIIIVNLIVSGEVIYTVQHWGDIPRVSVSLATIMTGIHIIPKKVYMLMKRKKYRELFARFSSEIWISPDEDPNVQDVENEMMLSNISSASMIGCVVLFDLVPLISTWNDDYSEKEFPFQIAYMFNIKRKYLYECFYLLSVITGTSAVALVVGHDTILNYFLIHTTRRIKHLSSDVLVLTDNPNLTKREISDRFNEIRKRHTNLIAYVAELENYYSFNILLQFITTAFLMCVQCIQVTYVELSLADKIKVILYLCSGLGQLFVNSYSGEKLTDAGLNFGQAVYNSNWVAQNFDLNLRKKMIIIIQRAQTPIYLTGMKFFNLSLNMFCKICRSSGSYFALMQSLIEDQS